MKFGLGVLRLPAHEFWSMTPRELQAAYEGKNNLFHINAPIARESFIQMMSDFPDEEISRWQK